MRQYKKLKKAFGLNEFGLIDFPIKISNVKISRISNFEKMGGCSFNFHMELKRVIQEQIYT